MQSSLSPASTRTTTTAAANRQTPHDATSPIHDCDVAIAGAGPVGLALAGWLTQHSGSRALSLALIDQAPPDDARAAAAAAARQAPDPRFLAISHGSRDLLETLTGMKWPAEAAPIERIHVSQHGYFGRTLIDKDEHGLPALGYTLRYDALLRCLRTSLAQRGRSDSFGRNATSLQHLTRTEALPATQDESGVTVPLVDVGKPNGKYRALRARILIHAEGGLFTAPEHSVDALTPRGAYRDYQQTAIVSRVSVSAPQHGTAFERFTREGPVALLPIGLPQTRGASRDDTARFDYALVWCCRPDTAVMRADLDDASLLAMLQRLFGERVGRFLKLDRRTSFPLGLRTRPTLVDGRVACIGNAAQTLHPVAGQGLNLGLRDAWSLADALANHGATPRALAEFGAQRRLDRALTIGFTDLLARGFAIDSTPLGLLRGAALTALEFVPPVKSALARQMMFGQRS